MLVLIVEIWAKFEPKIAKNYQKVPKKRLKIDLVKSSRQKSTWSQSWEIDLTRLNSTDSEHYPMLFLNSKDQLTYEASNDCPSKPNSSL